MENSNHVPATDSDISVAKQQESARRLYLRVTAKLMVCVAVVMAFWIILSPLLRSAVPVNTLAVETVIAVNGLAEDNVDVVEWFDKPLIVARRSAQTETLLSAVEPSALRDANNIKSIQPDYANNATRSPHSGWFLAIGIGTSSGCAVRFTDAKAGMAVFTDACDHSQYDFAGRALKGSNAKKNLPVPHWRYEDNKIFVSTQAVGGS